MRTNLRHVALGLILALGCATAPASKPHGLAAFPTFPATSGGGLTTVTTSSPVSGNGSVGTPVTIASGAITNASLANPLPSGSGVVKVTSGTASVATKNVDYTAPSWFSQQLAVIQAIDPTINTMPFATECQSITTSGAGSSDVVLGTATATGNVAQSTTESGGIYQFSSGTTAGSTRVASNAVSGSNGKIVFNPKTQHWALAARVKIVTTPDAQTGMKILDLAGGVADHIFGVQGSATSGGSTTNWSLWINGSGNTFATISTPLTIGMFVDLIEVFDGATLHGLVNGTEVGSITDLTNFDTGASFVRAFAQNGTTAANQQFDMDTWAAFTARAQ